MGEGESKDVNTGLDQVEEDLVTLRGGANGGYDSRASHVVPFVAFDKSYEMRKGAARRHAPFTGSLTNGHDDVGAVDVHDPQVLP